MQLQEQFVTLKFAGGIETKMDSKAVPSVRLLGLENGVFTKAISIKKRNGYAARSRAIDGSDLLVEDARRNAVRDNEYLLFTDRKCYSQQTGADKWTDVGAVICAIGSDRPAVHTSTAQTMPDHATNAGVTVYAWEDSRGGVWWTVVDAENGHVYRAPVQADASGQRPRCIAVGEVIHIYFAVPAQRQVKVIVVNPATPTAAVSATAVIDDLDTTNPVYDAVPTAYAGTPGLVAWHEHATTNVRVGFVTAGGLLGSPSSGFPSVITVAAAMSAGSPIAVACSPVEIAVAYQTGGSVVAKFFATTIASVVSTQVITPITTATRIAMAYGARQEVAWVAVEETASQPSLRYCITNSVNSAFVGTPATIRSVGLASRAFALSNPGPSTIDSSETNDVFAVFVHDTTYFNTYVTLRLSDFLSVGRHLPGSASGAPTRTHLSSVHVTSDDVAKVVLPYKSRLRSVNNDKFTETALRVVTMDFASDDSHQCAQIGAGLYMAAACPQHYDGRQWTEQGFHFGPEYVPVPGQGSGGALTPSSTYGYKFWYEWTDGQGEIHRGPESVTVSVTTGGAITRLVFQVPTLRVTSKSNVRIGVGRCLPGDTSRFWRVSSLDPTVIGSNGFLANSTTVDSVTFTDDMSDANLQLQEELYTTGGVLSNDPAPLGSIITVGKNRVFYTDAQNRSRVRFSQRIADGYGMEIAPELVHDVDPEGGGITAMAYMDDVIYCFKREMIWAFNGDGPLENGASTSGSSVTGFSASQKISPNIGCADPSSIVVARDGIFFKSLQGIYLLKRSREVVYIGAPVELYNSQTVRRACALPKRPAIIFLTDSGKSLYYDYEFGQWSTFTNHEGYDAAVVDGVFQYLRINDIVFRETVDEYTDAGSRIPLVIETAWIHMPEHLQGFQRFWRMLVLGTWTSPHQFGISYRLDYCEAWNDPSWLDATGGTDPTGWLSGEGVMTVGTDPLLGTAYGDGAYGVGPYGGTPSDAYQWRYGIFEGGQAIQLRFEDFEKAGLAGASFELTEMTIIGGVMKPDIRPFSGARSM